MKQITWAFYLKPSYGFPSYLEWNLNSLLRPNFTWSGPNYLSHLIFPRPPQLTSLTFCLFLKYANSFLPRPYSLVFPFAWNALPKDIYMIGIFTSFKSVTNCIFHKEQHLTTLSKTTQPFIPSSAFLLTAFAIAPNHICNLADDNLFEGRDLRCLVN